MINTKTTYKFVNALTKKWCSLCLKEFVVIDFETTGLSEFSDHIIEVCAIRYINGSESDKYLSFVKPPVQIPSYITKINGITNEMVSYAPDIKEVVPKLLGFIGDSIIVAHNASFDMKFLVANSSRLGVSLSNNVVDTLYISRKLYPQFKNHKLITVLNELDIEADTLHRSSSDATACAKVLLKSLKHYTCNF
jgi:DNA polymerase III epsilon subunit family exonuclease